MKKASFTTSISCTSPHDASHYHHTSGVIPPDGGALEHRQDNRLLAGRSKGLGPSSLLRSHRHNSPEAPCSSPAWQSSLTLPPAPPRSRPAVAATRGQSSSEPRCRVPRERPDRREKSQLKIRCQTESLTGKMATSQTPMLHHFLPCTLRCGDVRRCSSSFSSLLIGPVCSSSATCRSQHTTWYEHVCSSHTLEFTDIQTNIHWEEDKWIREAQVSSFPCWWPVRAAGYGVLLDEHQDDSANCEH